MRHGSEMLPGYDLHPLLAPCYESGGDFSSVFDLFYALCVLNCHKSLGIGVSGVYDGVYIESLVNIFRIGCVIWRLRY